MIAETMKPYSLKDKRIWVAGSSGMVGSAIIRRLADENPAGILNVSSKNLDLRDQAATHKWVKQNTPVAAQPIREDSLMTGPLEPTNAPYAVAKIAGVYLCETYRREYGADFISAMPTNLYGPGDNYHPENSHVIPALIRRAHEAKLSGAESLSVWGSGTPRREFLNADDCADALVHVMKNYSDAETINIGSGTDMTIAELAQTICEVVGFEGELVFDTSKPDGTPRKLMSGAKLQAMNWSPKIGLREGLAAAYADFQTNI